MTEAFVHESPTKAPLLTRWLWLRAIIRFGYVTRGFTYFLVGYLAFLASWGRGQAENTPGALTTLLVAPLGRLMLLTIAFGLLGFGLWRACQAGGIEAPAHAKWRVLDQLAYGASAFVYFILGFTSISPLIGSEMTGGEQKTALWVNWLMSQPFGAWLIGAVGVIVFGVGFYWCISAFFEDPMPSLTLATHHRYWIRPLCSFGLITWGVALGMTGVMFLMAVFNHNSERAGGFEGSLRTLRDQTFGAWLLMAVALGLAAFGGFSILEGMVRRLDGRERLFD